MNRLERVIREATTMADIPQFKHIPLPLTKKGKAPFLKKAKVSDILDSYKYMSGER